MGEHVGRGRSCRRRRHMQRAERLVVHRLTGQSLSAIVASNTPTITFTGCAGTYLVTVTGAATAQVSINGGAWVTSGAISSGQTLQVRLTSSGTANTMLTATSLWGQPAPTGM